jgi:hypothetical protein
MIERIDIYIGVAINGIFTGLGVAIGTWLAQNHILDKLALWRARRLKK